ncbi:M48 family metalloprotease [Kitasatospora sp. NPDC058965]|uniref:M48 family metalloprotease n=1 Tax=Kitasatospora sp. NPDC058965 TaxID=3346682 RepID=UPI0036A80BF4
MRRVASALLALGLLASMYLLALLVVLVGLVFVFVPLTGPKPDPAAAVRDLLLFGPMTAAVVVGVLTVSRPPDAVDGAVPVSPEQAPALWELVTDLAAEVGTRPPAEILLVASANAEVAEEAPMLGLLGGRRRMYLGVPLLVGMTVAELSAVLCHELGHYAGRDTRAAAVAYRGAVAVDRTLERLRRVDNAYRSRFVSGYPRLLAWALARYAAAYRRLSLTVRRSQEITADAVAAATVGPQATADALRSVHLLALAWEDYRTHYVEPVQRAGFRPADPVEPFRRMLRDERYRNALAKVLDSPGFGATSPEDTHPALAERLRTLASLAALPGRPPVRPGLPASAPAGRLVAGAECLTAAVQDTGSGAVDVPVDRWTELAAEASAAALAEELVRAVRRIADRPAPTLGTVLDVLERGTDLWLPTPAALDLAAAALFALVGQALVRSGQARWELTWTGPSRLLGDESLALHLADLAAAAVRRPADVDRLRLQLVLCGLDLAAPALRRPTTASAEPDRPAELTTIGPASRTTASAGESTTVRSAFVAIIVVIGIVSLIQLNSDSGGTDSAHTPYSYRTPGLPAPTSPGYLPFAPLPTPPLSAARPPSLFLPSALAVPITVTVQPGDTLGALALKYHTTVQELQSLNGLGDSTEIGVGRQLVVEYLHLH